MIKKLSIFLCLFMFGVLINAQVNNSTSTNNWKVGGNVGINFGNNNYFGLGLYPMLGYQISPQLIAGTTLGYTYQKNDYYKNNLFSGGPFLNYALLPQIFTRVHLEYFNGTREVNINFDGSNSRKINDEETALWIGGGYQTGGRIGFQIGLMYNVLYDENSSIFGSAFNTFSGVIFAL